MLTARAFRPLIVCSLLLLASLLAIGMKPDNSAAQSNNSPLFSGPPSWGPDHRLISETNALRPSASFNELVNFHLEKNLSMAASPANRNLVLAGYEVYGYDNNSSRLATSTDGGMSWTGSRFDQMYFGDLEARNDALIAFNALGTAYYATLSLAQTRSGYLVFTSTNGLTWGNPSIIVTADYSEYRFLADLAVDPRMPGSGQYAGSVYFASTYYLNVPPYVYGIRVRYSRDGGQTWGGDAYISDPGHEFSYRPSMKVASNGTIYAAFEEVTDGSILNVPRLFLDRSTDGGQTWGVDHLIGGTNVTPIGAPDYKYHELVIVASDNCDLIRINHYPIIGISPTNPDEVYVVWNDGRWDTTQDLCSRPEARHSDIAFIRTTDGGKNWSAPMRLNDDPQGNGIDQWQPNMEVAPDGTIGVTWYDRRYSANHYDYDVVYTQSTDGGLTWSANQRVTDQSSDPTQLPDGKGIDDVGYRTGMVFGSNYVLPGWIDTRDDLRQGHLYVDRGVFSSPTAGPSVTATATRTGTPTRTATSTPTAGGSGTPTLTPTSCTLSFSDVPVGSTFYPFVRCLSCLGIVNGYADGTFRPSNNVTRGQLSKIVSNAAGFDDVVTGQSFEDVPPGSTFYTFTERLASRGVMGGYPCGGPGEPCGVGNLPYFRPNSNATRGQISKIVSQAAGFVDPPGSQIFEDVLPGSTFYDYVQRLASRGYMSGYPCGGPGEPCGVGNLPYFRPGNNATRGQVSKIVSNTFFPDCNPPR